jgi:hypothetical protein
MVPHVGRLDCAVTGKGPAGGLSFSNVTKPKAQDREEVVEILVASFETMEGKKKVINSGAVQVMKRCWEIIHNISKNFSRSV